MSFSAPSVEGLQTAELVELAKRAADELGRRSGVALQKKPLYYQPCQHCKAPIAWLQTEKEHWVALEDAPGPYIVVDGIARHVGGAGEYAFHYATCPSNNPPAPQARTSKFDGIVKEVEAQKALKNEGGETNESTD